MVAVKMVYGTLKAMELKQVSQCLTFSKPTLLLLVKRHNGMQWVNNNQGRENYSILACTFLSLYRSLTTRIRNNSTDTPVKIKTKICFNEHHLPIYILNPIPHSLNKNPINNPINNPHNNLTYLLSGKKLFIA
jgi:hypothetical protein